MLYLPRGFPHATSTFNTSELLEVGRALHSTSLTISLLLESVTLTYDKLLRCAAGIHAGVGEKRQCKAAEEVLRMTPLQQSLRQVLPFGFLVHTVVPQVARGSPISELAEELASVWAAAVAKEARRLVEQLG